MTLAMSFFPYLLLELYAIALCFKRDCILLTFRHHYQNPIVILLHYFINIAGQFFRGNGQYGLFSLYTDSGRQKLVAGHHRAPVAVGMLVFSDLLNHKLLHLVKLLYKCYRCQLLKYAADDFQRTVFLYRLILEYCLRCN